MPTEEVLQDALNLSSQPGVGASVGVKELNWACDVGENVGKNVVGAKVG